MRKLPFGVAFLTVLVASAAPLTARPDDLHSLNPEQVFDKLDLTRPGLEAVRAKHEAGDRPGALQALLSYYRAKYPVPKKAEKPVGSVHKEADQVVNHVFQWGPYEAADYGQDINWEWDPRGDIEWVAAVYRFYWARPLTRAYRATRHEKYAKAFVELTSDWIAKHPLEKRGKTHYVYKRWRGFAWLEIQTGIRIRLISEAFPVMIHAKAFTPEFLGVLLASVYDHQLKTERFPRKSAHNKALMEQHGFAATASTFAEFKEARHWVELALTRSRENFLAQVTTDGVQREWSFGYHLCVLRDATGVMRVAESMGVAVPDDYRSRLRKMNDYVFSIATPDLGGPMFGDASRPLVGDMARSRWPLYKLLLEASDQWDDPKYAARARLDRKLLPKPTSHAFPEAGIYAMRNDWGPDQIYFALHCSPPALSGHDQADNGTFELYAYGRWLMPDTGFFTYGHDPQGRAWHRQTRVHQTLTLDGKTTRIAGRQLLWQTSPELDVLAVENASYKGLVHRRTVWFVDKPQGFFVLLDEAIGDAQGTLELHFQFAPGEVNIDPERHRATTAFDDANVLVWTDPKGPVTMHEEEGWFGWSYGHRKPRKAFCYRHAASAPATFLTVICPYRGTECPEVLATLAEETKVGANRVELQATAFGKTWRLGRDLATGKAWCNAGRE